MNISVIIPTRNRIDYINPLIKDLLHQDISNFEIIVVDQSDDPVEIKHCKHIVLNSTGPCISRNIGAKEASGDILVFLDDDARVAPDFISEISKPIMDGKFNAVAGANCDVNGNYLSEAQDYLNYNVDNFIKVLTRNPNSDTSRICISFPGCCSAILKGVFDDIGGFDEQFDPTGAGEDRDMALRLFKKGYMIWYNAQAKLLHIGATTGGSRDVGSRTLMLDVHTYFMCQKYFSAELAYALRKTILRSYRKSFFKSLMTFKLIRTKFKLYETAKNLLKQE
ncbi:glycosyltransferase family 2 protein [Seonamhaeicola maritimus]|uniref:glycosyltransferase family 2 protein n=1 Tax=Seonamhaeicola maritimus TaxID=2591822 RepID=UPI002494241A|nr:glycosyltransferase [Seonamhaeicola maritimus]